MRRGSLIDVHPTARVLRVSISDILPRVLVPINSETSNNLYLVPEPICYDDSTLCVQHIYQRLLVFSISVFSWVLTFHKRESSLFTQPPAWICMTRGPGRTRNLCM